MKNISKDLCIISNWACLWKMPMLFSQENASLQSHPVLTLDDSPVIKTTHNKP